MSIDQIRKIKWHFIEISIDEFFFDRLYHESIWAKWERRIKKAEKEDIKYLENKEIQFRNLITEKSNHPSEYDLGEILSEDAWEAYRLYNNMYAALIVSIWSDMESFFKNLIHHCSEELNISQKAPYQFEGIKKFFKNNFSIRLGNLKSYSIIDAIRIINNSYKHNKGKYKPISSKPQTIIDGNLLNNWNIKRDSNIDYTKLPIKNLIISCSEFLQDLVKLVKKDINKKISGGKNVK